MKPLTEVKAHAPAGAPLLEGEGEAQRHDASHPADPTR
jgi:hypothetical protein